MENYNFRFLVVALLCLLGTHVFSQAESPTCRAVNVSVDTEDSSTISVSALIENAADAAPMHFRIRSGSGFLVAEVLNADENTSIKIPSCKFGTSLTYSAQNALGTCGNSLTLHPNTIVIVRGHSTVVYCTDSLVISGEVGSGPEVYAGCNEGIPEAKYVGDWFELFDCNTNGDTSKIIYREYEAIGKSGVSSRGFDTIKVLRLPTLSVQNTFCAQNDTTYCEDGPMQVGPYLLLPPIDGASDCDTLYFLNRDGRAREFDPVCGIVVNVSTQDFDQDCGEMTNYTVSVKQSCTSDPGSSICAVPGSNAIDQIEDGYLTCSFWLMELDTLPPLVDSGADTITVSTGPLNCNASFTLPTLLAKDSCGTVIKVKAMVDSAGTVGYEKSGDQWVSNQVINLPMKETPYRVVFEAFDNCHNLGTDTCYIYVKDLTRPIAVANKKLNISLGAKKSWIEASSFDEVSWDNCEINMLLARRTDWQQACVSFCDSIRFVDLSADGDSIWTVVLGDDPIAESVEVHYAKGVLWLNADGEPCSGILAGAWEYDLMKYATVDCKKAMTQDEFDEAISALIDPSLDIAELRQMGGGWSEEVPFSCEDVCNTVKVELLVMDYWCNWSTSWSDAYVEDKSEIGIPVDVRSNFEISCDVYRDSRYVMNENSATLEDIVLASQEGDEIALIALDQILGGYKKVWEDENGFYVDAEGVEVDFELIYQDSVCECRDSVVMERAYDETLMSWIESEKVIRVCDVLPNDIELSHGAAVVNCIENVHCIQTVTAAFEGCGQGVIRREWKLWKACPGDFTGDAPADAVTRTQEIWVGATCELDSGMFIFPKDTSFVTCVIEYNPDGSGNVGGGGHPDSIGRPIFTFSDACRTVGVGYSDKVLDITTGEYCKKIVRTWCFLDWCSIDKDPEEGWVDNPEYAHAVIKYTQQILVECECVCSFDCSGLGDTTILCDDMPANFEDVYAFFTDPTIVYEDPEGTCDYILDDTILVDTLCNFGTITKKWYLIDEDDEIKDSCVQVITLSPGIISVRDGQLYRGDAEPNNCFDEIVVDPIQVVGACAAIGPFTITNDLPPGQTPSGTYPVDTVYINYTVANACVDTMRLTDTIMVIDDVDPTLSVFEDPCVTLSEWQDDFGGSIFSDKTREALGLMAFDNCEVDTILLLQADSVMYGADPLNPDSVKYITQWQAVDIYQNLSDMEFSIIFVSDLCGDGTRRVGGKVIEREIIADHSHVKDDVSVEGKDEVVLRIGRGASMDEFKLFQNVPNPFKDQTKIGFVLPERQEVTISIFDLTGKLIKEISGPFERGYHEMEILQEDLQSTGVLYYRFDSPTYSAVRKMILIE